MENPLDISVSTKPQYDNPIVIASKHSERGNPISSPYFASGDSTYSPSLAEGARGCVNPTLESQTKSATANDKNATASSSLRANEVSVAISKKN